MSQNAAELTVQDLRNMRRSFSRQELLDLIDRMFTDEHTVLDMDVVDAAIFRLLLAEGQEPTPDNLQKRFSEVGQYYLRVYLQQFARLDSFDRGLSAHGHEYGRFDNAVGRVQPTAARAGLRVYVQQFKFKHRLLL